MAVHGGDSIAGVALRWTPLIRATDRFTMAVPIDVSTGPGGPGPEAGLPAVSSDIEGVIGLSDIDVAQSSGVLSRGMGEVHPSQKLVANSPTAGPQPCTAAINAANSDGSYTADQLASYYDRSEEGRGG